MDAAAVRAVADEVLGGADRLGEIRWPSLALDELAGSSVERAAACSAAEDRLADVVAQMRSWAAATRAAATAIPGAEARHADRLGAPR